MFCTNQVQTRRRRGESCSTVDWTLENFNVSWKAHNFNAAWRDGDHIHEGLGFLTQHTKLSNMFELAMQAVDPSVTLPYWDYTIESAADQTVFDSVAFTPETFGTLVEPKNHTIGWTFRDDPLLGATIRDGRWVSASNLTQP